MSDRLLGGFEQAVDGSDGAPMHNWLAAYHRWRNWENNNYQQNFANLWRARSRLYQNEIFARKYAFDSIFQALQDLHPLD